MQLGLAAQINWTLFNEPLAAAKCTGVRPSVSLNNNNDDKKDRLCIVKTSTFLFNTFQRSNVVLSGDQNDSK